MLCGTAAADLLTPIGPTKVKKPRRGMQMVVGPVQVPSSSEITECTYFKNPSTKDMAVGRVKIEVEGGSHHIHIYRPVDHTMSVPDGHETCDFALDFDVWQLVLASQSITLDWRLPKGIAFKFRAGEQLLAQTHFVDNGLLSTPEPGWATFNLYSMKEEGEVVRRRALRPGPRREGPGAQHGVRHHEVRLPAAGEAARAHGALPFPRRRVHGQQLGRQNDRPGALPHRRLQRSELPALLREAPARGAGARVDVPLRERHRQDYTFGPFTDRNEHCNLFGFYYPTAGESEFMTCVQKESIVVVNVKN